MNSLNDASIIWRWVAALTLRESARQWVLNNLPHDRADADLVAYLSGLDVRGLLIVYHNWITRLVNPRPRRVRKSKAFEQNPIVTAHSSDFAQIIGDIESGNDLRKYLSRGVEVAAGVPGKKRPDLDLMLNDWGIHHLHISTQVEANGYVKRDGPLLFAMFTPLAAYLIDVMSHKDWTCRHVLDSVGGRVGG